MESTAQNLGRGRAIAPFSVTNYCNKEALLNFGINFTTTNDFIVDDIVKNLVNETTQSLC